MREVTAARSDAVREITTAPAAGGDARREPGTRAAEEHVSSPTQARQGPAPQTAVMSPSCCQTPLAPGFVLWTPSSPSPSSPSHSPYPSSPSSVLVVMFTWLFCTPPSAARYVALYTQRGWHVLHVSSRLLHFAWPPSSKSFALDIARVLRERCGQYSHVVVHAMSIGAYNYTTCQMVAGEEPDLRTLLFDKLRAVVLDSLTMGSLDHMVRGIATGVSPWGAVQALTRSLAGVYFRLTHQTTVRAFHEGVEFFRTRPAHVPTLVLGSENDPMSDVEALRSLLRGWAGVEVTEAAVPVPVPSLTFRVWSRSGHCAHLRHHGQEYRQLLHDFILSLRLPASQSEGGGGEGEGGEGGGRVSDDGGGGGRVEEGRDLVVSKL